MFNYYTSNMIRIKIILFLLYFTSAVAVSGNHFTFDNIIFPKWECCYIFVTILSVYAICSIIFVKNNDVNKVKICKPIVFFFITVLSVLLLYKDYDSFINVLMLACIFLSFWDKENINEYRINASILIAGLTNSLWGIWQFASGKEDVVGTYDSHVGFSLSAVFAVIVVLYSDFGSKKAQVKVFRGFCLSCLILSIFISSSRTGILAVAISLIPLITKKRVFLIPAFCFVLCCSLFFKTESTKGRFFIYNTTFSILDTPKSLLIGKGENGFRKYYMIYQAKALKGKDESIKLRADNIKHPLNEIMLLLVNYGATLTLLCIGMVVYVLFLLRRAYLHCHLLMAIIIFSFFAYPFKYPITWIVLAWILAYANKISDVKLNIKKCVIAAICSIATITIMYKAIKDAFINHEWTKAQNLCYIGLINKANSLYSSISEHTNSNYFHYSYASFLNKNDMFDKAVVEIDKCSITDYDTQMLRGDINMSTCRYLQALQYYWQASDMCPNRFKPLFSIFCIYKEIGNKDMTKKIGQEILNKRIKVNSAEINEIKRTVKYTLKEMENNSRRRF